MPLECASTYAKAQAAVAVTSAERGSEMLRCGEGMGGAARLSCRYGAFAVQTMAVVHMHYAPCLRRVRVLRDRWSDKP